MDTELDTTPIITWVQRILSEAVSQQASDIHLEPFEDGLQVRYRIAGALHQAGY